MLMTEHTSIIIAVRRHYISKKILPILELNCLTLTHNFHELNTFTNKTLAHMYQALSLNLVKHTKVTPSLYVESRMRKKNEVYKLSTFLLIEILMQSKPVTSKVLERQNNLLALKRT